LTPTERSELLCQLLVISDELAISIIKRHMPLDGFDKAYLLSNAGGIMRPEFEARLVAAIGLPSEIPKLLNLDLSGLPLEKHFTVEQLSKLAADSNPEIAQRVVIATAMSAPEEATEALEKLCEGLAPEEMERVRAQLAFTWVVTNPTSLIAAANASPSILEALGGQLGKDPSLNSPENLPLRDILDKAAFDHLRAGVGSSEADRAGVFSYLVQSHPSPTASFRDAARAIGDPETAEQLMRASITHWTERNVVGTTHWLNQQSNEPEYGQWVQAFVSSCKDPDIVKLWSVALPAADDSQDQQPDR
jgi:hypothetical protein